MNRREFLAMVPAGVVAMAIPAVDFEKKEWVTIIHRYDGQTIREGFHITDKEAINETIARILRVTDKFPVMKFS